MNKMVPYCSSGVIKVSLKFTLYTRSSLTLLASGEDVGVNNVFSNPYQSRGFLRLGLSQISCMEPFKILLTFFLRFKTSPHLLHCLLLGDSVV